MGGQVGAVLFVQVVNISLHMYLVQQYHHAFYSVSRLLYVYSMLYTAVHCHGVDLAARAIMYPQGARIRVRCAYLYEMCSEYAT